MRCGGARAQPAGGCLRAAHSRRVNEVTSDALAEALSGAARQQKAIGSDIGFAKKGSGGCGPSRYYACTLVRFRQTVTRSGSKVGVGRIRDTETGLSQNYPQSPLSQSSNYRLPYLLTSTPSPAYGLFMPLFQGTHKDLGVQKHTSDSIGDRGAVTTLFHSKAYENNLSTSFFIQSSYQQIPSNYHHTLSYVPR